MSEKPTWEQIEAERLLLRAWCKEREEEVLGEVLGRLRVDDLGRAYLAGRSTGDEAEGGE